MRATAESWDKLSEAQLLRRESAYYIQWDIGSARENSGRYLRWMDGNEGGRNVMLVVCVIYFSFLFCCALSCLRLCLGTSLGSSSSASSGSSSSSSCILLSLPRMVTRHLVPDVQRVPFRNVRQTPRLSQKMRCGSECALTPPAVAVVYPRQREPALWFREHH
jgi:hypothetical protein